MAQLYSTGPAHLFVAAPGPSVIQPSPTGIYYLGTCEHKPRISVIRSYKEVFNDIGGQINAIDYSYQGQAGFITTQLTRWNELVYQSLITHQLSTSPGTPPGSVPPGLPGVDTWDVPPATGSVNSLGDLMVHEGLYAHLYIVFPKSSLTFYNGGGGLTGNGGPMPGGYHFYATNVMDQDTIDPGTDALVRNLQFRAVRTINVITNSLFLYDYDMSAILGTPVN